MRPTSLEAPGNMALIMLLCSNTSLRRSTGDVAVYIFKTDGCTELLLKYHKVPIGPSPEVIKVGRYDL